MSASVGRGERVLTGEIQRRRTGGREIEVDGAEEGRHGIPKRVDGSDGDRGVGARRDLCRRGDDEVDRPAGAIVVAWRVEPSGSLAGRIICSVAHEDVRGAVT